MGKAGRCSTSGLLNVASRKSLQGGQDLVRRQRCKGGLGISNSMLAALTCLHVRHAGQVLRVHDRQLLQGASGHEDRLHDWVL